MRIALVISKLLVAGICFFAASTTSFAGGGGLYIGTGLSLSDFKARYDRRDSIDLFPSLNLKDLILEPENTADTPYYLNAFLGYRFAVQEQGLWFDLQFETVLRTDGIEGRLTGFGELTDGTNIEDIFSDDWTLETKRDRTAVVRLGTNVHVFGLFNLAPYMLGGFREIETSFERKFVVCGTKLVCAPGEQGNPATEFREPVFEQWVSGVGIEKTLGRKTLLQFEARFTTEATDEWKNTLNGVDVPSSISADSYEVALRLAFFF